MKPLCANKCALAYLKIMLCTNYSYNIYIYIFSNPSTRAGYDKINFFKRNLTGLNSKFPSPRLVASPRLKKNSLPYYLPINIYILYKQRCGIKKNSRVAMPQNPTNNNCLKFPESLLIMTHLKKARRYSGQNMTLTTRRSLVKLHQCIMMMFINNF